MAAAGNVVVWINAFIPGYVKDYTIRITNGENAGKTAIPLPWQARAGLVNLAKAPNTGYLTDQRTFSERPSASVRMQSYITISLPGGQVSGVHQTSGTTEVNTETGETRDNEDADMSDCRHSPAYSLPYDFAQLIYEWRDKLSPTELRFFSRRLASLNLSQARDPSEPQLAYLINVVGSASDPCVYAAANIDYDVHFVIRVDQVTHSVSVTCVGLIDDFPAFEAYAKYLGETKTLFNVPPPPGNTVVDLLGAADRPIIGATTFGPADLSSPAPTGSPQPNLMDLFQLR